MLQRSADESCGTGHGERGPVSPLAFSARAAVASAQHITVTKQSLAFAETHECGLSRKMFNLFHSLKPNRSYS